MTQRNAVSSPPKANMLMSQMRLGGEAASRKTSAPMMTVDVMDKKRRRRIEGTRPRFIFSCM